MRNYDCGGFVQPEFSKTNRVKAAKSLSYIVFSLTAVIANAAQADGEITPLWQDSKLDLQLRNYYFSREFSDLKSPGPQRSAEWAQGAVGSFKSGYSATARPTGSRSCAVATSRGVPPGHLRPLRDQWCRPPRQW